MKQVGWARSVGEGNPLQTPQRAPAPKVPSALQGMRAVVHSLCALPQVGRAGPSQSCGDVTSHVET